MMNNLVIYTTTIWWSTRAYKDKQLVMLKKHWEAAIVQLHALIAEPQACY